MRGEGAGDSTWSERRPCAGERDACACQHEDRPLKNNYFTEISRVE